MKFNATFNALLLVAASAALLAGCGGPDGSKDNPKQPTGGTTGTAGSPGNAPASGRVQNDIKITLIAKSSNNPVFLSARTGAEAAAKAAAPKA
jgi:ribose transport system substrate-binding protein